MNFLYLLNYFMAASLMALMSLEVGVAFLYLFNYKKSKTIIPESFRHLWEIVGTFAVFYLINLESTYPKVLASLAHIYEVPFILAGIILLFKNSFIAYSYHIKDAKKEKVFQKIYGVSTLLLAFAVTGVFLSAFLGFSVNFSGQSLSLLSMLFNWKTIVIFSIVLLISSLSSYKKGFLKALGPLLIMAAVISIGIIGYPYMFGGTVNMLNYITKSGIIALTNIIIAVLGYSLLATVFLLTIKISKSQKATKRRVKKR